MYVERVPNRNSPPAILIRESYREGGKVKKNTLANISKLPGWLVEEIAASLKRGEPLLPADLPLSKAFSIKRSLPHGHVAAVLGTMRKIGLPLTLARKDEAMRALALAAIAGRILFPGSKLAPSRGLRSATAASTLGEELGLDGRLDENDIHKAMRWLYRRKERIEKSLVKKHVEEGGALLCDMTSTWMEGRSCLPARFGYSRDRKRGKLQINIALVCNASGLPVAVEVFEGDMADPSTLGPQLETLRRRFGIRRIILVADRGMPTGTGIQRLKSEPDFRDYGWIGALESGQIRKLVRAGEIQPGLFDRTEMAEIRSEELFPGERLVVCRNPFPAGERRIKRGELIAATREKLEALAAATRRAKRPCRGKERIARRLERECAKHKVLKHFRFEITETSFDFELDEASVAAEAATDGIHVIRSGRVPAGEMDAGQLVETYKSLSNIERVFRTLKTMSLKIRPVFHSREEMVRARVFVCMLAAHVQWHMEQRLKPLLFHDEEPGGAPRSSPAAKARRSESALAKTAGKKTADGLPAHSFQTLIEDLATLCRNRIEPKHSGSAPFDMLTKPTRVQSRALSLLGVKP